MDEQEGVSFEDPRLSVGSTPIGDGAGEDLRGEFEFDEIEDEVRKMALDGATAVDWKTVIEKSTVLLNERSKDLMIGTWLAYGLHHTEGYHGLALGLSILRDMVADFWDDMYPPARRERGRVNAMEWLVGRLAGPVSEVAPSEADADAVVIAADALGDIDRIFEEKLKKETLALGELVRALRPHKQAALQVIEARSAPAPQPEPEPQSDAGPAETPRSQATPTPPAANPQPAAPAAAPPPPQPAVAMPTVAKVDTADVASAVGQMATNMRHLATALLAQDPADWRAALFSRTAIWLPIHNTPSAEGRKTGLPAPEGNPIGNLDQAMSAGNYRAVLNQVEQLQTANKFWIDLQRYAHAAHGAMGPQHASAQRVIADATLQFVDRFPAVLSLTFNDETPFASAATKRWLEEIKPAGDGGGSADDPVAEGIAEARKLAGQGKIEAALKLIDGLAHSRDSGRGKALVQATAAEIAIELGQIGSALFLLEHLVGLIEQRQLIEWEPELAARICECHCQALVDKSAIDILGEDERNRQLAAARRRLAQVDMAALSRVMA